MVILCGGVDLDLVQVRCSISMLGPQHEVHQSLELHQSSMEAKRKNPVLPVDADSAKGFTPRVAGVRATYQ